MEETSNNDFCSLMGVLVRVYTESKTHDEALNKLAASTMIQLINKHLPLTT